MIATFRFARPPFFSVLTIVLLAAAPPGFLVPWLSDVLAGASPWPGLIFFGVVYGVFAGVVLGARALVRRKRGAVIEVHDEHVVLPLSSRSRRYRTVRYDEITSLNVFGTGWLARLLVASGKRNFVYLLSHLEGREAAAGELRATLRRRIAALPNGAERLRELEERDARGASVIKKPQHVSLGIIAIVVAAYLWTRFEGALDTPFGLVAYGANVPALVRDGEWYRLLSANFLHINFVHLYLNGLGILVLGSVLERLVGAWRFLAIYLVSAVTGSAASAYAAAAVLSVGASTAVFGLLGALAYVNWRFRKTLPGGFSQPLRWWILILGINAALPILVPVIDWAAHVGGFAGGVVTAHLLCRDTRAVDASGGAGNGVKAVTAALTIVFAFALVEAAGGAYDAGRTDELRIAREFVQSGAAGPRALNALAWDYATRGVVSDAELDVAEEAARQAVEAAPDNESVIDTLATIHYRRGDFDRAISTERRAVAIDARRVIVSQMGRFLDARLARAGPLYLGGAEAGTVEVTVEAPPNVSDGVWTVVVTLDRELTDGAEVFVLDKPGNRLLGTLHLELGPGLEAGEHRYVPEREFPQLRAARVRTPVIAYVDASGCTCERGSLRGRYFAMARDVAELP